tara:strand:- start:120 stop:623 length:504 start_codon:yes stop_codon:yes gene_type:complete
LKFSENIRNIFKLALIAAFSLVFVIIIGQTNFAYQIELITFTPYYEKTFILTVFTLALLGNYMSIYQLWKRPESKSIVVFAILYSLLLMISSILLLVWLSDMEKLLDKSFEKLKFPNDVDEVIYKLRVSFLNSISWIFLFLGSTGLVSFSGVLVLQKSLFKNGFKVL